MMRISGSTATPVNFGLTYVIICHSTSSIITVASNALMTFMPTSVRTACRSLMKRAIRSPVLCSL